MHSAGRGRSAEPIRGCGVHLPCLSCTNGVTDSRTRFPEQMFPSPPTGVSGLRVVRPETDSPHGVKRAGLSRALGASALKVLFHSGSLSQFGKIDSKDGVFFRTRSQVAYSNYARLDRCVCAHLQFSRQLLDIIFRAIPNMVILL